jgi:hypothetical protein
MENNIFRLKLLPQFGFGKADVMKIKELQNKYGFSDEYASFLEIQNGFNSSIIVNEENPENASYLVKINNNPDDCFYDLRYLYGIGDDLENYYNVDYIIAYNIFSKHFFMIGEDHSGNHFVEVLHGKYKGYIGSIDHNAYSGSRFLEDFLEFMQLENFNENTLQQQCDILVSDDLGILIFHAKSMDDFVLNKLYIDSTGITCVKVL